MNLWSLSLFQFKTKFFVIDYQYLSYKWGDVLRVFTETFIVKQEILTGAAFARDVTGLQLGRDIKVEWDNLRLLYMIL